MVSCLFLKWCISKSVKQDNIINNNKTIHSWKELEHVNTATPGPSPVSRSRGLNLYSD